MKRRVREVYSPDRPAGKRSSHFFSAPAQEVYLRLRDLIERGEAIDLFRHLNFMNQKRYSIDKQCYPQQQTALHLAVLSDRPAIVNAMVRAGANFDIADENNLVPIFLAAKEQRLNSLICLIGALGPDGYKTSNRKGQTLLHMAVYWGATKVISDLLHAYSGDKDYVNCRDAKGNTPLYYVSGKDDEAVVRALLDAGADPLVTNDYGVTPHFQAAINDASASLVNLLTRVKEINYAKPGIKQRNLLHVAAFFGSENVLRYLFNSYRHDKDFLNAKDLTEQHPYTSLRIRKFSPLWINIFEQVLM